MLFIFYSYAYRHPHAHTLQDLHPSLVVVIFSKCHLFCEFHIAHNNFFPDLLKPFIILALYYSG